MSNQNNFIAMIIELAERLICLYVDSLSKNKLARFKETGNDFIIVFIILAVLLILLVISWVTGLLALFFYLYYNGISTFHGLLAIGAVNFISLFVITFVFIIQKNKFIQSINEL